MTHYLIVKLNEGKTVDEYLKITKPIFNSMVSEIDGFISYEIDLNKAIGPNNFDIMVKMNLKDLDTLTNYKPHYLHKKLKEDTKELVLKKAIFDF